MAAASVARPADVPPFLPAGETDASFRSRPNGTGLGVWTRFDIRLTCEFRGQRYPLPRDGVCLLAQAARAYDEGAITVSAITCRASLETTCALFLVRALRDGGETIEWPRDICGRTRRLSFEEVRDGVLALEVLTPYLAKAMGRIYTGGSVWECASQNPREGENGCLLWGDPSIVLQNLRDTAQITLLLFRAAGSADGLGPVADASGSPSANFSTC